MPKGQLQIEFIISVAIFAITITYVATASINKLPYLHNEANINQMAMQSLQISELFLFDEGYPEDWDRGGSVQRLGLSSGNDYELNSLKVSKLNTMCSDYESVKSIVKIENVWMLEISKLDGTIITNCKPSIVSNVYNEFVLNRYASLNGDIVKVEVRVMK
ncbi:MAG: hypothetical protein J4473_01295 [Candidatus Aenigmarchaeota archaeon]|nr:hypothetical protein [Candidatus Aenigmarchaeota archaeon]